MHFHLPKPLHGWRAFVGEVGIIVVGVLIALGAEQVVEAVHWKSTAAQADSAIREEVARNGGVYDERALIQHCADTRLEELTNLLKQVRQTRALPDIGLIGNPPDRLTVQTAWNEAASSGALTHMDNAVRSDFAILYAQTGNYDEDIAAEQLMWSHLRELEHAPGPISDAMLADATATASTLQFQSQIDGVVSAQAVQHMRSDKIVPSYLIILDHEGSRADVERDMRRRALCKPLMVDAKPFALSH